MKKILVFGLMILLTCNSSAQITGACWTLEFPDFFSGGIIPETKCADDFTQQECMSQQGVGGIVSAVWFPMTSCDGSAPPESNESGSCTITSGSQAGRCLDEYEILDYASSQVTTYNMTSALCGSLDAMYTEGGAVYIPDTGCVDFVGACTFTQVGGSRIDEATCNSLAPAIESYWLQDKCCIQGDATSLMDGLYVNEYSCEQAFTGTFHGVRSTCEGIPPSETGSCTINSGAMEGVCIDETDSGDAMTQILCQEMGEFMGENYFFQANQSCSELAGACHLNALFGVPLDETACKALSPNAVWLGYTCCVPDKVSMSAPVLPILPIPTAPTMTINMNEAVCEGLLGGSFQGVGVSCSQFPADPTGACFLTSGPIAGVCLDEDPNTQTPLNEQACQYVASQLGTTYEFYPDHLCGEYVGACRFYELSGIPIGEQECLSLFEDSVWLGSECCVEDEFLMEGSPAAPVTESLCESFLDGVFCGIGSSCTGTTSTTQAPVQAPEYPSGLAPIFVLFFAAGIAYLGVKGAS